MRGEKRGSGREGGGSAKNREGREEVGWGARGGVKKGNERGEGTEQEEEKSRERKRG